MIQNYFKTAFRQLWRNRLFTALNIFGLAIGVSACWIIYRIVDHEFSYDDQLPNSERIYRVVSAFNRDGNVTKMGGVSAPLYQGIEDEVPGVEHVVPVFSQWVNRIEIMRDNQPLFVKEDPSDIVATCASYFEMLPYRWLAGDKRTALSTPDGVVLTESRAKLYFPDSPSETVLHRTISYYGRDTTIRRVTGIVSDYDRSAEFVAQEFIKLPKTAYETYMWTNTNGGDRLYLQFLPGVDVADKLLEINRLNIRHWAAFVKERERQGAASIPTQGRTYELLPIREARFATDVSDYGINKTSKPILYGLTGIGAFLLILACINYINMSVAQIPQRGKEIGVRKTLGGGSRQLIGLFLCETLVTALVASALAFGLSRLAFWLLQDIMPAGISPTGDIPSLLAVLLGLALIVTLLAGVYPGWLITRVKTVDVFKNLFSAPASKRGFRLQQLLIVFQFTIALVFISCTIIVSAQLRHTLKADMGFNKNGNILVDVPWKYRSDPRYLDKQFTLLSELRSVPGIDGIAMGTAPLSSGYSSSPFDYPGEDGERTEVIAFKKTIDTAYLKLYGMELLAGRSIRGSDTISEFVINETAARAFGFKAPEEAIGQFIGQRGNGKHPIVGVVSDFHTQDFYTPITPTILSNQQAELYSFNIRLDGRNSSQWQTTLKAIGEKWALFYPAEAFQYHFYNETIEAMYKQERQINKLITLASGITVFISCLGLFGLASLTAFQRTKEIGIRKVLGATFSGIVTLLSKDFMKLVIVAALIASPVAWWAMHSWLADFAYRIAMEWWMFALAGLFAVVIALLTVGWHAIRVAIANPVESLRDE